MAKNDSKTSNTFLKILDEIGPSGLMDFLNGEFHIIMLYFISSLSLLFPIFLIISYLMDSGESIVYSIFKEFLDILSFFFNFKIFQFIFSILLCADNGDNCYSSSKDILIKLLSLLCFLILILYEGYTGLFLINPDYTKVYSYSRFTSPNFQFKILLKILSSLFSVLLLKVIFSLNLRLRRKK